jgi:putative SOS response-associated peptidase YedK
VQSCTIVTMPANQLMTEIHNVKHRMPAILTKEDRDAWLTGTSDQAFQAIKQYPDTHNHRCRSHGGRPSIHLR